MNAPADGPALSISAIEDRDIPEVIALWQRCGSTRPWNDPEADIALARKGANATILLGRDNRALVASVLVGHDGHRGWVYYVTVDPDHRFKGFGRMIMIAAEDWLRARGIEKMQLMVRGDNTRSRPSTSRSAISSRSAWSSPNGSTGASRRHNGQPQGTS